MQEMKEAVCRDSLLFFLEKLEDYAAFTAARSCCFCA
jgi:hypothetical protein